jgi:RNA polymerase sigma-70 factor, ECF subfamily
VIQEAFLRAWRACASFDPAGGPPVNWLLAITANTAIDLVKARIRRVVPLVTIYDTKDTASCQYPTPPGIVRAK